MAAAESSSSRQSIADAQLSYIDEHGLWSLRLGHNAVQEGCWNQKHIKERLTTSKRGRAGNATLGE